MKTCKYENCERRVFSQGYCDWHYPKKPLERKPMNQYNTKEIKKVSTKLQSKRNEYKVKAKQFLKENPVCQAQWGGCTYRADTCHHAAGRMGELLNNENMFRALCLNCHQQVEIQVERAKAEGLSMDRLTVAKKLYNKF